VRKFINIINESQAEDLEKVAAMSDDMQEETPVDQQEPVNQQQPVEEERPVLVKKRNAKRKTVLK
jgi:hypothetical protein